MLDDFHKKHQHKPINQHPIPIQRWIKKMETRSRI